MTPIVRYLLAAPILGSVVLAQSSTGRQDETVFAAVPAVRAAASDVSALSWSDLDGDGRLDVISITAEGRLRLLANRPEGFEDVAERVGLGRTDEVVLALSQDYDGDGRNDIFVGRSAGTSLLLRNVGEGFVDQAAAAGLTIEEPVRYAHWLDEDGDGRIDLHVVTSASNRVWRGLEGGYFEAVELSLDAFAEEPGLRSGTVAAASRGVPVVTDVGSPPAAPTSPERPGAPSAKGSVPRRAGPPTELGGASPLTTLPGCMSSLRDQTNPSSCLQASSEAALGMLYPLSSKLFVDESTGNVGIGTTTPGSRMEVVGEIRSRGGASNGIFVHNPNADGVSVHLSWLGDVARLRYGGNGAGSQNGFAIQGQGDSTKLRLLDNGHLGLGEDLPQARLHVRTSDLALSSDALENDEMVVEAQDAALGLYSSSQGNWASAIALKEISGGEVVDTWGIVRRTSTATSPSSLRFTYGNGADYSANQSFLTIENDGDVGIATATPGDKLTVAGVVHSTSGGFRFPDGTIQATAGGGGGATHWAANGTDIYYNAGEVGIGTSAPGDRLHVKDGAVRLSATTPAPPFSVDGVRLETSPFQNGGTVTVYGGSSTAFQVHGTQATTPFALPGAILRMWNGSTPDPTVEIDANAANGHPAIVLRDGAGAERIRLQASDGGGLGRIITDVLQINGADLSEQFDVTGDVAIEQGMVVSIDPARPGKLTIAATEYDKKVAGIVSGAGGVRTGLVMGQAGTLAHGEHAVALTGRVWCQADASFAAIQPGDALTTSSTLGHAMKAVDHERARGAVIGKAMTGLDSGTGLVLVLVQPR
jgi:hypothetical protein